MKNTKMEMKFFTVPEWKKEEDYLREQHKNGWEYMQDFAGYSYFRKPAAQMCGEDGIFCDDASRLDMMWRVFKGRIIPLLVVFFFLILPNVFLGAHFGGAVGSLLFGLYAIVFVVYLVSFICFGYQYWKYWNGLNK